jgi:hypothetical protein
MLAWYYRSNAVVLPVLTRFYPQGKPLQQRGHYWLMIILKFRQNNKQFTFSFRFAVRQGYNLTLLEQLWWHFCVRKFFLHFFYIRIHPVVWHVVIDTISSEYVATRPLQAARVWSPASWQWPTEWRYHFEHRDGSQWPTDWRYHCEHRATEGSQWPTGWRYHWQTQRRLAMAHKEAAHFGVGRGALTVLY